MGPRCLSALYFLALYTFLPSTLPGQIIDTQPTRFNIALGANTDTNGFLYLSDWSADLLVDGSLSTIVHGDGPGGVTGVPEDPGFYYTIDLGSSVAFDGITLFPRIACCPDRLSDFRVSVLADNNGSPGSEVWGVNLFPDSDAMSPVELAVTDGAGVFEGRFVRVTTNQNPVEEYELQLAEIEVYSGLGEEVPINYALNADAYTNGTLWLASWTPQILTDGVMNLIHGDGPDGVTGLAEDEGFYYEIDLGQIVELAEIAIFPRQDGCCPERFSNYLVSVHEDDNGQAGDAVWSAMFRDDLSWPDTFDPDVITADADAAGTFTGQWIRVTSLDTQQDVDDGFVDYRLQLAEIEVYGHVPGGVTGDFDLSGVLDLPDIDDLTGQVAGMTNPAAYDLTSDSLVDIADLNAWVKDLYNSWIGDANLDGEFNSSDLVAVLASGTYEADVDAVWSTGDFDGNGRTTSGDLVAALADGGYEAGPRAAVSAVPEPSSVVLCLLGCLPLSRRIRPGRQRVS
jgi:hypothetical protein